MNRKKFEVKIYYSAFCTQTVEAKDEREAVEIARTRAVNKEELLSNLEPWKDADTVDKFII